MNTKISHLKTLRVYRHLSFFQIFSHLVCNRVMKSNLLVASAPYLYNFCRFFPGYKITNWVISNTFNKMFTGGKSLTELQKASQHLTKQNIPLIIDYCAQGVAQDLMREQSLDQNARLFTQSAIWAAKQSRFLISIKLSGLVDMNLLQKYNRAVQLRNKLWSQSCENGVFSSEKLYENFKKIYQGVTEQHYLTYLKQIHNFSGSSVDFKIDQIQFKMNHHPYYLYQPSKNALLLVKIIFPLDQSQQERMLALLRRLNQILEVQYRNPNDLRVLVDAEQSYIQRAIQSITEQMQQKYNKQKVYIIPTLQNYLKIAKQRADYELGMVKRRKLYFAVKLVRGAYLVQQTKIASQKNHETPIVSCFDSTTDNYLSNFTKLINSGLEGEIFCAGHNQLTIEALLDIKRRTSTNIRINFGLLFGLGDHLTLLLKRERESVYKLLPWAQTQVMIPYMIRRAQQLSQMRYPLDIQGALLRYELFYRVFGF